MMDYKITYGFAVLCLCLNVKALTVNNKQRESPVPLVFWSKGLLFEETCSYEYFGLSGLAQYELLSAIHNDLILSSNGGGDQKASSLEQILGLKKKTSMQLEAVVYFAIHFLDSIQLYEQGENAKNFLKDELVSSETSAVLPYTYNYKNSEWWPDIKDENNDKRFEFLILDVEKSLKGLSNFLEEKEGPVEIVVRLEHYDTKAIELMKEIFRVLDLMISRESYVSVLFGRSSSVTPSAQDEISQYKRILQSTSNSTLAVRSNPALMSAFLVTLFLSFFLILSLLCVDCVQAPSVFATKHPAKGKEFN